MVGHTINLISGTYHLCKRKKYTFIVFQKYTIIYRPFIIQNLLQRSLFFFVLALHNNGGTKPNVWQKLSVPNWTFADIMKVCATSCNIAAIHLRCGWFSSAKLINPIVFRRLGYDDCLVNDGKPLGIGESLSFVYANTFSYSG